ncbi:unnamed protein product [Taenia asiatica]|uniref:PH domain-containing protein n=1 Tax=Taenia asiatica TaxID=60517 RepID=A0A0R3VW17_TAEAS|nr:unnamed protein product [Taenia asiatica]
MEHEPLISEQAIKIGNSIINKAKIWEPSWLVKSFSQSIKAGRYLLWIRRSRGPELNLDQTLGLASESGADFDGSTPIVANPSGVKEVYVLRMGESLTSRNGRAESTSIFDISLALVFCKEASNK